MKKSARRIWFRVVGWTLLTPVLLFVLLMILLYVPPVQDFIRGKATRMASEATGMGIEVERIDLRFPLNLKVRGVQVTDSTGRDTLLTLGSLNVRVQAWPLLRGQVEVDEVTMEKATVNSAGLIEGLQVQGSLGRFALVSHGIDLSNEAVVLDEVELSDTHLHVVLDDTTASTPPDTTGSTARWRITLHRLRLENLSAGVDMPLDSLRLSASIGQAQLDQAEVDLGMQLYAWQRFFLEGSSLQYHSNGAEPAREGFDASHIRVRDMRVGIDSVYYHGHRLQGVIRECSLNEDSGLSITSLAGSLASDSVTLRIPRLELRTPHSQVELSAQTYWELLDIPTTGHLSTRLNAYIGKQDVLLLTGGLPQSFRDAYPFRPLTIHAGTEGNFKQMQISRFSIDLPGAFSMKGVGEVWNLTDSIARNGQMEVNVETQDLNFLTGLTGNRPDGSLTVPDNMRLKAGLTLDGSRYATLLKIEEQQGSLHLDAAYNTSTEEYRADLHVDSLQLHHFLPQDSIYLLTAHLKAAGKGFSPASPHTLANVQASLDELQYGRFNVTDVEMQAGLRRSVASLRLKSDNTLLRMQTDADLRLDRRYLDGKLQMDVAQVGMYELGLAPHPLKRPFAFSLNAEARHDSIKLRLDAGDMNLRFRARSTLKKMLGQLGEFSDELSRQIEDRRLDHAAMRRLMPSAGMHLMGGKENPVSYFLATKDITYDDFRLSFGCTPEIGINGRTSVHGLHIDSLQLDTIYFTVKQDTSRMMLRGGVINGPQNPQFSFHSHLTGEIRSEDAELTASYTDGEGNTGILFGINARPLTEGNGKGNGLLLRLTPEEPVIAFRQFRFNEQQNWLYLHKDMRAYANIDMESDDGLCFRMQSDRNDTVSLQNMSIELSRLQLKEICSVMPYMPRLSGLLSAEAQYIQTTTSLQLSAEANVSQLTYERQPVGDIGVGITWLPGENEKHYLNGYMSVDNKEVLMADGILGETEGEGGMEVTAALENFPLRIANAFVPDQLITLDGGLDGELGISGSTDNPRLDGMLSMDSVTVTSRQMGAHYLFDSRPVQIKDNQLIFDKFAIYTTSQNPFTIDGNVDFRNMSRPTATLTLKADRYTLLDAKRTRESLVYGKVVVDINAMVRGPLDGLTMRGSMNLLGSTDVTYVLTDSPLTVEDRMDGLVTFVSFNDTLNVQEQETPAMALGGMDMNMAVHIDDNVQLRADLSADRSKFIELKGGGDLNLQYTPQGDISLSGRYTLTGGSMKYSLPIIPLKEFFFQDGSYVNWQGDPMNPVLNLKATERIRASVSDGDGGSSRSVNFDVSISIKNRLEAPELSFDIEAPEDATVQNELEAMSPDERSKQAITMLATGIYLSDSGGGGDMMSSLNMGAALNSVLQSQINALAGSAFQKINASFTVGVEDRTSAETGDKQTDYSFRYSQRLLSDRIQIIIGGRISTGNNATNDAESFIDNISIEYQLDRASTRYIRAFHNKNYESVLDGEITETGVGLVLRRKMDRLSELFIFRRKNKKTTDKGNGDSGTPPDKQQQPAAEGKNGEGTKE